MRLPDCASALVRVEVYQFFSQNDHIQKSIDIHIFSTNFIHTYVGVANSIPVRSHTFVEIDHEIISTVILLPSADSFKKGCCQLQAKVCARITG